jgi:hypothetical protein
MIYKVMKLWIVKKSWRVTFSQIKEILENRKLNARRKERPDGGDKKVWRAAMLEETSYRPISKPNTMEIKPSLIFDPSYSFQVYGQSLQNVYWK